MEEETPPLSTALFSDLEIEVSAILLDLPNLVCSSYLSFGWAEKRRRSHRHTTPNPNILRRLWFLPLPPPRDEKMIDQKRQIGRKRLGLSGFEAASPVTPLDFSPGADDESLDEKLKNHRSHKKITMKRTREEWLEMIEGLERNREFLRREIGSVKRSHGQLTALNSKLTAVKKQLEFGSENLQSENHDQCPPGSHHVANYQPSLVDCVTELKQSGDSLTCSGSHVSRGGPLDIDLNVVPPEETLEIDCCQLLDHSRALVGFSGTSLGQSLSCGGNEEKNDGDQRMK